MQPRTAAMVHDSSCEQTAPPGDACMPKPNYAFEKRQRELEKKRKKEDKAASKKKSSDQQPPPALQPQDTK